MVLAHPGSPGQRAVKWVCVCVCMCVCVCVQSIADQSDAAKEPALCVALGHFVFC